MPAPISLSQRLQRKVPRVLKVARQWLRVAARGGRRPESRLLFVVGSQRSGTRVPLQVLDGASEVMTYSEGTSPYFNDVLLQPLPVVEALVRRSLFPVVALKPICETHRVGELLDHFPDSRAIWIFRAYRDAVNSASLKWRSGKESVRRLAHGELDRAGWRAGGLTAEKLDTVRALYRDDLSLHAANAIMWYLRNSLYFDLDIHRRSSVLLVRYEDLVQQPAVWCPRIFEFAGVPRPGNYVPDVFDGSVAKRPFPEIPANIVRLCDALEQRMIDHYRRTSDETSDVSGGPILIAATPAAERP